MQKRTFLFLQGGTSFFFRRLADKIEAQGYRAYRINFNAGDRDYWGPRCAFDFRDTLDRLPDYLEDRARMLDVSDIVLYSDQRPIHIPAIGLARKLGLRTHVFEEGYFRPYYITLERDGVNGNSSLPRDPGQYLATAGHLPEHRDCQQFSIGFRYRASNDIAYEVSNLANPVLFPHYHSHVPYNRWTGYAAHLRRFARFLYYVPRDRKLIQHLAHEGTPYYCLPLQLESDAQIRRYSGFSSMAQVIECVMRSFAAHAPTSAWLAIKNHPHDPGFVNFHGVVDRLSRVFGISGRTVYLETGNTSTLLRHSLGVVTVNSTTGLAAIEMARPVIVLGKAIYNLPGLAFQESLDMFWREAPPPNAELFRCFRNYVIHCTQINGGYYSADGIALAVQNSWPRLIADRSPLDGLL
jgi:capsular polysaccharide export protein